VNEDQLCFNVGINTGCSGCEHGTQNLCSWVALNVGAAHTYTCTSRELADTLVTQGILEAEKVGVSHCPVNPANADILDEAIISASPFDAGAITIEAASTIHHTWHDMDLADVATRPHAVDRTSLWAKAGAARLLGLTVSIQAQLGTVVSKAEVDCAALNDKQQLDAVYLLPFSLLDLIVNGNLITPRDAYCLRQIYGAYLSTRCPAYGTAYSGIELSLYQRIATNCAPGVANPDAHLSPALISVNSFPVPLNTLGYWVVPDGTPFAFKSVPIEPNGVFEDYTNMDEIAQNLDNEDVQHAFRAIALPGCKKRDGSSIC